MKNIVKPFISNYYGSVEVYKEDDKYYLTLGDWDGVYAVEISKELAIAIKEYFRVERKIEKIDL